MIRPYNLAEAKIADRSRCRREVNRRLQIVAALVGLTLIVAVGSFAWKLSIAAAATKLKSELGDVQQRCVRVKREMAEVKLRSGQHRWQREITQTSKKWLAVLEDILARLPADAWLTRIENSTQNNSVTLEGGAASYESVSALMGCLRAGPQTAEVRLTGSRITTGAGPPSVEFAVLVKLKAAAVPQNQQAPQPAGVPTAPGTE